MLAIIWSDYDVNKVTLGNRAQVTTYLAVIQSVARAEHLPDMGMDKWS